jgi:RimJ/RimL family protein N-acetyltransferase
VDEERVELHGELVVLRPFRPDEIAAAYEQARSSTARVGSLTFERFQLRVARSGKLVDGRLDLAIESDGRLVGSIETRSGEGSFPPGVCEIGVELVPEVRGGGLGTEAVVLLSRHLLATGFDRVQASTNVDNGAMRGALEKAGFALEGTLRAYMPEAGGGRDDYALYALTALGGGRR